MFDKSSFFSKKWPIGSILIGAAILYHQTLFNSYVWDDLLLFVNNPDLRLGDITWAKLSIPILPATTYFRPVVLGSFALEFHLLGVSASISHAINLAAYLAVVLLTFCISTLIFRHLKIENAERRAALAALLYAVHPALVESVAWSSGRFDLFATLFFLAAIFTDLKWEAGWLKSSTVGLLALLAMGSKETGLMLPLALVTVRLCIATSPETSLKSAALNSLHQNRKTWLALIAVVIIYLTVRSLTFHRLYHSNTVLAATISNPFLHILLCLQTWFFYLKTIFIPFNDIGVMHPALALTSPQALIEATIGIVVLGFIVIGFFRLQRVAILTTAGFLCLLPVLHIIPLTIGENIGQERFLVLPLVFFAMAICSVKTNFLVETRIAKFGTSTILAGWVMLAILSTYSTVPLWKNDMALWQWTHTKHPDSEYASYSLISAAFLNKRPDIAEPILSKLREKGDLNPYFQIVYGDYLNKSGQHEEGIQSLANGLTQLSAEKKTEQRQLTAYAYTAMAQAYFESRRYQDAMQAIKESYLYEPNRPFTHILESAVLDAFGKPQLAQVEYLKSLTLFLPEQKNIAIETRKRFLKFLCSSDGEEKKLPVCIQKTDS